MILPIDAADWEFVLTLAALRVDSRRANADGNRFEADAKSEELRVTAARVGPLFKTRQSGLVQTAEQWAERYLNGEDVPRLDRYFAEREKAPENDAKNDDVFCAPVEEPVVEAPAKARSRRKKEKANELRNAPSGTSSGTSDGRAGDGAPKAEAVQHSGPAARNAGPTRRRTAAPV